MKERLSDPKAVSKRNFKQKLKYMTEFFQTHMGRKFYNSDFPELVRQLKRLNDTLESPRKELLNKIREQTICRDHPDYPDQSSIEDEMIEKQAAEFIASVLPGATVQKKSEEQPENIQAYIDLWGVNQTKKDYPEAYEKWIKD